jgi:predicted small lipoprotein YifL
VRCRFARRFVRLAAAGALALPLAACGLKGSLDPPPSAATPAQTDAAVAPGAPPPAEESQPQAPRKRIFLDWLLD